MAQLRASDYRQALGFLYDVHGADATDIIVLEALGRLVPADIISVYQCDAGNGVARGAHLPAITPSEAPRDTIWNIWRENPLFTGWLADGPGVRLLSDYTTLAKSRKLPFYDLAMRPYRTRFVLEIMVDWAPKATGFVFDRCGRDFSERERLLLSLLVPHLRKRASMDWCKFRLTRREVEVLRCVANGKTNQEIAATLTVSSSTVRKHLENAFEKLGVHTRTAAVRVAFGSPGTISEG